MMDMSIIEMYCTLATSAPTSMLPSATNPEPSHMTPVVVKPKMRPTSGIRRAINRPCSTATCACAALASPKRAISYGSRLNARMGRTPSSVSRKMRLRLSKRLRICLERRDATGMMSAARMNIVGTDTRSTVLTRPPVALDSTMPATSISGAMTPICISMVTNIWTFVTSEVERVIRLAVPKRSTSAEENDCTLENSWLRRSAASLVDTRAERKVESSEATQPTRASTTMMSAMPTMTPCALAATPSSIMRASMVGRPISVAAPKRVSTKRPTTSRQSICRYLKTPMRTPLPDWEPP